MAVLERAVRLFRWIGSRELRVLLALAIIVAGAWGFIDLAGEVTEGDTRAFDEWAVRALRREDDPERPIGPAWAAEAARDLTALGSSSVLVLITLGVAGYLFLQRRLRALVLLAVAVVGGFLMSQGLKHLFDRPRPELVPHLAVVSTASFPSGHSMMSAVVYITLGALLTRLVARRRLKAYFLSVALLLAAVVGFTRIYLGVHYPTDVLAGWLVGIVWAMGCWLAARWLQRRGAVESQGADGAG